MSGEYVRAYLWNSTVNEKDLPTGYRGYLILGEGDKWVTLFDPSSLETFKVPVEAFDENDTVEQQRVNVPALVERIKSNRAVRRKYALFDGGHSAERAIKLLEGSR